MKKPRVFLFGSEQIMQKKLKLKPTKNLYIYAVCCFYISGCFLVRFVGVNNNGQNYSHLLNFFYTPK